MAGNTLFSETNVRKLRQSVPTDTLQIAARKEYKNLYFNKIQQNKTLYSETSTVKNCYLDMESEIILETFEKKLTAQRYASNTIKAYKDYARLFLKYVDNLSSLESIPISIIESFINEKVQKERISLSYQKGLVGAIKKIYELILNKKVQLDYLYPKRHLNKLPKFFSKEEVKQLLDNTDNIKHKAILTTIYSCGLRLSELLNLKIKDIRSSDKIIRINQSKGNKDRIISLPDKLIDILREYNLTYKPTDYLFEGEKGKRYSERSVQLIMKKSLAKANIKTEGTVHSLRHSYAMHLIQSGVDIRVVQELLGHENIKTTMIYAHIIAIDKKRTPSPLDLL